MLVESCRLAISFYSTLFLSNLLAITAIMTVLAKDENNVLKMPDEASLILNQKPSALELEIERYLTNERSSF